MKVGIEIGGTFTDLIAISDGQVRVSKVPSVPANPEEGVFNALEAAGIDLASVEELVHGSTVATNAVLERKGGRTALVTTEGFSDILLIQRQNRARAYDLHYRRPAPIVRARDVFGVPERMLPDGSVRNALGTDWQGELASFISRGSYTAVAISLLNAWANPAHESAIRDFLKQRFPDLFVTCSHEICREFREYERTSTTVLSAYVQPVIDRYLGNLTARLKDGGFTGNFSMMQSNGGRVPASAVQRNAVSALFSGPAAGVAGAIERAARSGYRNLITLDMGGTSTDLCLIRDGQPITAAGTLVDGLAVRVPVIDIATIGAGGGSLVSRDEGGMLHVGPRSAAAFPGPACYGRGGTLPTLTDAHVVRGTLRPELFLDGKMGLDQSAARAVFTEIAAAFDLSAEEMADNAIRVANANIVRAVHQISTELGIDPRDFVLVAFGGAGPLHAARVAEELGIKTVIVPDNAGVLSAHGLLVSDFKLFEVDTCRVVLGDDAIAQLSQVIARQKQRILALFAQTGLTGAPVWSVTLQMRLKGQAFEIEVDIPDPDVSALDVASIRAEFAQAYIRFYASQVSAERVVEIVGVRLGGRIETNAVDLKTDRPTTRGQGKTFSVFEERAERDCRGLRRGEIGPSNTGPLIVLEPTSTVFVPPSWTFRVDAAENMVLEYNA